METERIVHPIEPVYDGESTVLVLGSFPSVKSRDMGFFYGHPQNRYWKVMAAVFEEKVPMTVEERRAFLLRNHIAVWDVIRECEITGSSDSSIRNVVANDLGRILKTARIRQIFVNGKTAEKMYKKYIEPEIGRECICLPSTSPANAAWSMERLKDAWRIVPKTAQSECHGPKKTGECGKTGDRGATGNIPEDNAFRGEVSGGISRRRKIQRKAKE